MTTKNWRMVLVVLGVIVFALAGYAVAGSAGASIPYGFAIAMALVPLYFIIRQLLRPVAEPTVAWPRAILIPAVTGLAAGAIAALADEAASGNGLEAAVLVAITVPPALIVGAGLIFRLTGAWRPWLTGYLGVQGGVMIAATVSDLIPVSPVLYTVAGVLGFLWAVLVLGSLLPPVARLVVYSLMIVLFPVTGLLHADKQERLHIEQLERSSVLLMMPDVPGYELTSARVYDFDSDRTLNLSLQRTGAGWPPPYELHIGISGMLVPHGFNPPEQCPDPVYGMRKPLPCPMAGPELWRSSTNSGIVYFRRYDSSLYIVEGGTAVSDELVRTAAASLHPITAAQLAQITK